MFSVVVLISIHLIHSDYSRLFVNSHQLQPSNNPLQIFSLAKLPSAFKTNSDRCFKCFTLRFHKSWGKQQTRFERSPKLAFLQSYDIYMTHQYMDKTVHFALLKANLKVKDFIKSSAKYQLLIRGWLHKSNIYLSKSKLKVTKVNEQVGEFLLQQIIAPEAIPNPIPLHVFYRPDIMILVWSAGAGTQRLSAQGHQILRVQHFYISRIISVTPRML